MLKSFALTLALCAVTAAQQSESDLVTFACGVTSRGGAPVPNLTVSDFKVTDNGQPREVSKIWAKTDLPLTVAIIADVSGNLDATLEDHRDAIGQFLKQTIGPGDRAIIVQAGRQAWLIGDVSGAAGGGSAAALDTAVAKIGTHMNKQTNLMGPACRNVRVPHTCGESALWHAVYHTAMKLKAVAGRKAIVVLSDGMDTGSDVTLTDVIQAAQSVGAVVYSLKYSGAVGVSAIRTRVLERFNKELASIDRETGGLTFADPGRKTAEAFSRIESDLRNTYVLGFVPPADARDGRFHKLEVKATGGNYSTRAAAGYWANYQ